MSDETVEAAIETRMRTALTAAAYVVEAQLRRLQQHRDEQTAATGQRARELAGRYDAERAAARAQLAVVRQPQWWDHADPTQVSTAWQTATAWRDVDPIARHAGEIIDRELRTRYGAAAGDWLDQFAAVHAARVEASHTAVDAAAANAVLNGAVLDEAGPVDVETARQVAEHAQLLADAADGHLAVLEGDLPPWDSDARRQELVAAMQHAAVPEDAQEAALVADLGRGTPPAAAAAAAGKKATGARTGKRLRQRARQAGVSR
jgi:colicin import membrane protein